MAKKAEKFVQCITCQYPVMNGANSTCSKIMDGKILIAREQRKCSMWSLGTMHQLRFRLGKNMKFSSDGLVL